MKQHLFLLTVFIGIFFSACHQETIENSPSKIAIGRSITNYKLFGGQTYIALLKENGQVNDNIYLLRNYQYNSANQTIAVAAISESNNGLEILKADGNTIFFSIQPNVSAQYHGYSLITLSGSANYARFYQNGSPKSNPDIDAVKCGCKVAPQKETCDSGGVGSTDCSVEVSGTVAGSGVTEKCSVKCGEGTYACCKK